MLRYFDMMYYFLATFYKRFYKKRSSWEIQAIFVVSITQLVLLSDLWMLIVINGLGYKGSLVPVFKVLFFISALTIFFLNLKRYEKKYLYYNQIWGDYVGVKKSLFILLSFFTVVFAWCFVFFFGIV